MDNNNWRPAAASQGAEPSVETGGEWRTQLLPVSRKRIIDKITETLKKHLPLCPGGLEDLKKIAVRFEEKIYSAATSQPDYLRKISMKMLTMEAKSQNTIPSSLPPNPSGNNNRPPDSGVSHNTQPQTHQQNLPQNILSNMGSTGVKSSANLTFGLPPGVSQNPTMQNISGVPQSSSGNSMGQGVHSNMFANPQRQMPGRQQVVPQQQPQNSQQYEYPQQLIKHNFPQGNLPHMQQQQNILHPTSQQCSMQSSSVLQPSMIQSTNLPGLQQNHPSSGQQSMLQHPQSVIRQQPQLMAQQPNTTNMQQNQFTGQQNNLQDLQQQNQHQHLMAQQNNISSMHHHQQLGSQRNVSSLQHQLGTQPGNSAMQNNQHSLHMIQRPKVPLQQQPQQNASNMLPAQQQLMSQMQSQQTNQPPGSFPQQQNVIDQQKQIYQSQRSLPETSSTSLDSTAETGNSSGGDWQEEAHQKIKAMKQMYLPELHEIYQKLMSKLQMLDSHPQQPKPEQFENLKKYKSLVDRMIAMLHVSKTNILPGLKENLGSIEKQIASFINSNKARKSIPPQQGQLGQPQMQQSQSQVQPHENQMNAQIQSMSMQGSVPNMQQNMMNSMQASSSLEGNGMGSLQQTAVGSLQQNTVSGPPQQGNFSSSQGGMNPNMLQPSIPLQSNPNMLQHQENIMFKQRQMQLLKQQIQFNQQPKQQLPAHQMHPMNDMNELKMRQGMGVKPGVFQRTPYNTHQQMKPGGASFPISSPQLLQAAASPQLSQNSSPQIDQQNLLSSSLPKARTPLQPASSPFIVPSPSTPLAPSPMPGDAEKPLSGLSSLSNGGNIGQQQANVPQPPTQSLAIGTPGISASPLLAEFAVSDGGGHGNAIASGKSSVSEQPLERLIKAVKSVSSQALSASVSDIGSVVSMIDRISGAAPGKRSRAVVGEDLAATTNSRLQARNVLTQDGTRKMKWCTSAMPLNVGSSAGSLSDSFKLSGPDASDLESTATSTAKRPRIEANNTLLEEIREINLGLIDTVVDISEEDVDPTAVLAAAEGGDGTIVKCSFIAVALSPNLKSEYASAQMSPIQPLRLLVPTNYPNCSPVLLDKLPVEISKEYEDLSVKAKSRFGISLRTLSEPMSLGEMTRTWDVCARSVISEHAREIGGGGFSSKYGTWESCLSAA